MAVENCDGPETLELLASALAGRSVGIGSTEPGAPAWTDGTTIFLDHTADRAAVLESLAVQTSLLAAGSLQPEYVRRLVRRPALARRYLALEGRRVLALNAGLLPGRLHNGTDVVTTSSAESLARAGADRSIVDPPTTFGAIRASVLLKRAEDSVAPAHVHGSDQVRDGDDVDSVPTEAGDDPLSSPVGAGGALGKLLGRLTSRVRQVGTGGPAGGDAVARRPTTVSGDERSVVSRASRRPVDDADPAGPAGPLTYPEWDARRRSYRPDWCTVVETAPNTDTASNIELPQTLPLRRALTRLAVGLQRCGRQRQGDDIDIDSAVESRVQALAGAATEDTVYLDFLRRKRELSVLVLLDISGSAKEPGHGGRTVHEHQRLAAGTLVSTLHELGDRVALYGFCSQGRSAVYLTPVKRFDDAMGDAVLGGLGSLVPGAYSRLGAAIRHGAAVLQSSAGTPRQLLVVLTDGLAYDHGYERDYGAADARRALAEARHGGIGCLCLTVGAGTDVSELRQVFGTTAHAAIPTTAHLAGVIGPLFRSALQSADLRRRKSQGLKS